jgi:AcrR family transcriptional regulator
MSIVVEHEKRKREILDHALDVFLDEGYSGASYQKIADSCGIARTILYTYFKNKQEIFRYTIKQATETLEESFKPIIADASLSCADKLNLIGEVVIRKCVEEKKLFSVVLEYLLDPKRARGNPDDLVRRRVIKLRMLITRVLMDGIESGEFKKLDIRGMNEAYYALIEASIVKLTIMRRDAVPEIIEALRALSAAIVAKNT